jgi:hypothetical protein
MQTASGKYKLGLKPVTAQPKLKLANYLTSDLPSVASLPLKFGHDNLVPSWGMDLNDRIGDCAIAAAIHTEMLYFAESGKTITFDQSLTPSNSAVVNYSAVTGYQPGPELSDPQDAPPNPTDQGTDIAALFKYWLQHGIVDGDGGTHQIVGYAGLPIGDWDTLLIGLRLFQTVTIGINVPDYAEQQFAAGQAWHVEHGLHRTIGGHCIPVVARDGDAVPVVTWGEETPMERPFYEKFCIAAVVGFSEEMLTNLRSIDAVDDHALRADLTQLNTGPIL